MTTFIIKRTLWLVFTLWLMVTLLFFLIYVIPGDIGMIIVGSNPEVDPAQYQLLREKLGLDKPIYVQYVEWIWHALHGDLGESVWTGAPVTEEVAIRFPYTASLMIFASIFTVIITLPIGIISTLKKGTFIDNAIRGYQLSFMSMPVFWIGTLVLRRLIDHLPTGMRIHIEWATIFSDPLTALTMYPLPAIIMALAAAAVGSRLLRLSLLEQTKANDDKKPEKRKVYVLPAVSTFGLQIFWLLGATVIMESLFNVPGWGTLLIVAVNARDIPLVMGVAVFFGLFVLVTNFLVDIIRGLIDPRVRSGAAQSNLSCR